MATVSGLGCLTVAVFRARRERALGGLPVGDEPSGDQPAGDRTVVESPRDEIAPEIAPS